MPTRHTLIEEDHTDIEWQEFRNKLERLDLSQLKRLAEALNIHFAEGAEVDPEEYRNVLDESYWDEFEREYVRVI